MDNGIARTLGLKLGDVFYPRQRPGKGQPTGQAAKAEKSAGNGQGGDPANREDILKWNARQIRELFASYGLALHDWDKIRTDWLTFHKATEREGAGKIALVH